MGAPHRVAKTNICVIRRINRAPAAVFCAEAGPRSFKVDPPEGAAFHCQSLVEGVFYIRGLAQQPARIRASLAGTLRTRAFSPMYGSDYTQPTHTLFGCHEEIQPSELVREVDEARQPFYSCKVAFQFPSKTRCCEACGACSLPPSLDVTDSDTGIKSEYTLSVTVDHYVIGRVTKSTTARKVLPFISDPAVIPTTLSSRTVIPVPLQKLREEDLITMLKAENTRLPPYSSSSSSLQVEVLLPEPPIFFKGEPTPITIFINTPTDLLRTRDIYLRSVATRLATSVSASNGSSSSGLKISRRGCELAGRIRIGEERFRLESGAWGSLLVVHSSPTFRSCLLRVSHVVEVVVGVSQGLGDEIHYGVARLDAIVMEPPPAYEDSLCPVMDRG